MKAVAMLFAAVVLSVVVLFIYGVFFATPYNPNKDPEMAHCYIESNGLVMPVSCNEKGASSANRIF